MGKVAFIFSPIFLKHDTGAFHPERKERLEAIINKLKLDGLWDELGKYEPNKADKEHILRIHSESYYQHARDSIEREVPYLDSPDTNVSRDSFEAALYAAGAGIKAADLIMEKEYNFAFCAIRPPGHHAEKNRAMGFCIFNNVAILARYLQNKYALKKIMIIDWDVHHGNGTQNAFYSDDTVYYISTHQYPHYPGTGAKNERGTGKGEGYTLNIPMPPGVGDKEYLEAFEKEILPTIEKFKPDFLLISAGFDAHKRDPLSSINLNSETYGRFTKMLLSLGDIYQRRIISLLEGGYDLTGLSESVSYHIKELLDV